MAPQRRGTLREWRSIPAVVHLVLGDGTVETLDRSPTGGGLTRRETIHHIVEAGVVAASIVTAALGSPGCVYDWTWMMPFGAWMDRMAYREKPVDPALALLDALNAYVAAQVEPLADGLARTVRLRDEPEAELRTVSVAEVLLQEVDHAREHARALGLHG